MTTTKPDTQRPSGARVRAAIAAVVATVVVAACASPAGAAQAWRLDAMADTTVAPSGTFEYIVQATNVGDAAMDGSEIDVTARLPPGLRVVDARFFPRIDQTGTAFLTCKAGDGVSSVVGASDVKCVNNTAVPTAQQIFTISYQLLELTVRADPSVTGTLTSSFAVSGGGAAAGASTVDPIRVAASPPGFGVATFDGQVVDAAGNPVTQAGGHPADATVSIDFNTYTNPLPIAGPVWPVEPVKDVTVDLPPGLTGDPAAVDQCTVTELAAGSQLGTNTLCPATSQVGTVLIRTDNVPAAAPMLGPLPVFNMVPPPNAPARFGFNLDGTLVVLDGTVRTGGDYGITINSRDISEAVPVAGTTFTFWGVPSDPSHNAERACPEIGGAAPAAGGPSCPSGAPRTAFLRNPTSCTPAGQGLTTTMHTDSWVDPGVFEPATWTTHLAPFYPAPPSQYGPVQGTTGCDRVPFTPSLSGAPQTQTPNTPSGFGFDMSLPQSSDPDLIGESDLRRAVVTLPAGVRINPSAADGLQACAPAQIRLHDGSVPDCPDASKVGSVTIRTPLLRDPLPGSIYLASPNDNPFGTLLSIYLVAEGSGVVIKLAGRVDADPVTGQLTATFDNTPQTPFSDVHLEFDGGPRAQLVTPAQCQSYTTRAVLTGWNGRVVESDSGFTISGDGNGGACPAPRFQPALTAGTSSNRAGAHASMLLRLTRSDLDQELQALTVSLPGGLTGKIASVALCGEPAAANGTCPDASKIGDVTVGAGAGSNPFFITNGRAYITGPYKGAPFGVSIVVPAVAGPFNLGNVVVRSALFIDKHTASVRVVTDPLPTILQGIPLQVRDVRVNVDRPGFFLNPTNCAAMTVTGTVQSTGGMSANVSNRYQAADCASLAFKPKLTLSVGGKGHTRAAAPTPLTTTFTLPHGDANLRWVRVSLPTTINARLTVINDACTRAQFESNIALCAHAKAGTAVAVTPLLRDPLRGSVYFVKNGHPIPDLFVALRGQVAFDLIGRVTIPGGRHLATTFNTVPDVPVRSFTLSLLGDSKHGSVGAAVNLCTAASRRATAAVDFIAQNGRVAQVDQRLKVNGCPKSKARRARRRR